MTSSELQQLDQRLSYWRADHTDVDRLRSVYRHKVLDFTLNSMALAGEPVDRNRVKALQNRRADKPVARTAQEITYTATKPTP